MFSFPGRAICPESPGMSFPRGAERNSISELNASSVPLPAHSSLLPNPYPPHHSFRTVRFHLCTRDRRVSFNTILLQLLLLFLLLFFVLPTVVVNVFSSGIVSGATPAKPASIELRQGSQLMTPRVFATVAACARARALIFRARAANLLTALLHIHAFQRRAVEATRQELLNYAPGTENARLINERRRESASTSSGRPT